MDGIIGGTDRTVLAHMSYCVVTEGVYTQLVDISALAKDTLFGTETHVDYHEQFLVNELNVSTALHTPHAYLIEPVFTETSDPTAIVIGYLQALVPFDRFLWNVLPEGVSGVYVVLENTCGDVATYVLNGNKVCTQRHWHVFRFGLECSLLTLFVTHTGDLLGTRRSARPCL